jgi:hypothetical protein
MRILFLVRDVNGPYPHTSHPYPLPISCETVKL